MVRRTALAAQRRAGRRNPRNGGNCRRHGGNMAWGKERTDVSSARCRQSGTAPSPEERVRSARDLQSRPADRGAVMETHLADWIKGTPDGIEAESILRTCVHCGFCNATCPTYQILGDELDGPRGRIYQIKQMLEGHDPSASTLLHLDRCLTCMNCET